MNWAFWISTQVIKRYRALMGQYDGPNKAHFIILNYPFPFLQIHDPTSKPVTFPGKALYHSRHHTNGIPGDVNVQTPPFSGKYHRKTEDRLPDICEGELGPVQTQSHCEIRASIE